MNPYRENKFHTWIIKAMIAFSIILLLIMVFMQQKEVRLLAIFIFLPFLFYAICVKRMAFYWNRLEISDAARAKDFGFPDFGTDFASSCKMCTRKMSIWYTLFIVTAIVSHFLPRIGRIVAFASQAFLFLLLIGQSIPESQAKRALNSINPALQPNYRPIIGILRIPTIYQLLLVIAYATYYDLITH